MLVDENDAVGFFGCRACQKNSDARPVSTPLRNAFLSTPPLNWKKTRSRKMLKMVGRTRCSSQLTIGRDHDETARAARQRFQHDRAEPQLGRLWSHPRGEHEINGTPLPAKSFF
ncbi:hypothetical protein ABIC09_002450 [Bradyrhizobium sp. S3.12.5]|uniref:hypothetical protein n=1 Tax=Bradyrhizobium sp. S3.12.5 TaxID=3156386 RepID=UPI0033941BF9